MPYFMEELLFPKFKVIFPCPNARVPCGDIHLGMKDHLFELEEKGESL
jgi:hypothetical protein